jgi:hypothetical protein
MESQLNILEQMQLLDNKKGRYLALQKELPKQLNEITNRWNKPQSISLPVKLKKPR